MGLRQGMARGGPGQGKPEARLPKAEWEEGRHVSSLRRGQDGFCGAHLHAAPDGAWRALCDSSSINMAPYPSATGRWIGLNVPPAPDKPEQEDEGDDETRQLCAVLKIETPGWPMVAAGRQDLEVQQAHHQRILT